MATWHGYVRLEINAAVADALVEADRDKIRIAVKRLITQTRKGAGEFPSYHLGHPRWRNDRRAIILEGNWDTGAKADFVRELAAELGRTQTQINNNLTIARFAPGGSWVESRTACEAYLQANSAEWEADSV